MRTFKGSSQVPPSHLQAGVKHRNHVRTEGNELQERDYQMAAGDSDQKQHKQDHRN